MEHLFHMFLEMRITKRILDAMWPKRAGTEMNITTGNKWSMKVGYSDSLHDSLSMRVHI